MSIRRVIILHGYTAHPGKHWFGWLAEQLAPHGIETHIPALPDTDSPDAAAWTDAALAAIGTPASDTVVIGHSLGTITAIRALGRAFAADEDARLGGLVVVAPFVDPVPGLSELDPFADDVPELAPLAGRIDRRLAIHSDHDSVVPIALAAPVIAGLDAEAIEVPGGGHLMESEGWTTLPPLVPWILAD
ncbi:alpha/beta fold hydrolase [Salinibacterium sp. ZJ77]|uniref:RBBP9/YdeN family alpha/beta hydrolase n=1 Tax=Salinibacterium sp. ZJ77 TaxID=2708337 RepID=UPI00141ED76D|nr:alpha/beta fold hydrolase [Salinibacterium sp. ZJ77]